MKENYTEKIYESIFYTKEIGVNGDGRTDYISITTNLPENRNLIVKMLGYEECDADKRIRAHTFEGNTLHFIIDGKGYFDGIHLGRQDGFMVKRDCMSEYYPDRTNPWTYVWINFDGEVSKKILDMAGLTEDKCTFSVSDNGKIVEIIRRALDYDYSGGDVLMQLNSFLLEIFSCLFADIPDTFFSEESDSVMEERVKNGINFINKHFREKNCIAMLAEEEKVDRHYLARLFKMYSDNSPQAHVIRIRIEEAKRLLRMTTMPISDVANAVGYDDAMQFSKIFRKHTGVSPSEYRKGSKDIIRKYE